MEQIFKNIKGVKIYLDDILIEGSGAFPNFLLPVRKIPKNIFSTGWQNSTLRATGSPNFQNFSYRFAEPVRTPRKAPLIEGNTFF